MTFLMTFCCTFSDKFRNFVMDIFLRDFQILRCVHINQWLGKNLPDQWISLKCDIKWPGNASFWMRIVLRVVCTVSHTWLVLLKTPSWLVLPKGSTSLRRPNVGRALVKFISQSIGNNWWNVCILLKNFLKLLCKIWCKGVEWYLITYLIPNCHTQNRYLAWES